MAEDFIERMQIEAKLRFGKTLSPSEVSSEFQKHDFESRIQHLASLKTADSFSTPREAAARHVFERELRGVHERLRKIDR